MEGEEGMRGMWWEHSKETERLEEGGARDNKADPDRWRGGGSDKHYLESVLTYGHTRVGSDDVNVRQYCVTQLLGMHEEIWHEVQRDLGQSKVDFRLGRHMRPKSWDPNAAAMDYTIFLSYRPWGRERAREGLYHIIHTKEWLWLGRDK
jgi:hypothetical protein